MKNWRHGNRFLSFNIPQLFLPDGPLQHQRDFLEVLSD